jgi:hypothetical protein
MLPKASYLKPHLGELIRLIPQDCAPLGTTGCGFSVSLPREKALRRALELSQKRVDQGISGHEIWRQNRMIVIKNTLPRFILIGCSSFSSASVVPEGHRSRASLRNFP